MPLGMIIAVIFRSIKTISLYSITNFIMGRRKKAFTKHVTLDPFVYTNIGDPTKDIGVEADIVFREVEMAL
jgi:hypothetical protein